MYLRLEKLSASETQYISEIGFSTHLHKDQALTQLSTYTNTRTSLNDLDEGKRNS